MKGFLLLYRIIYSTDAVIPNKVLRGEKNRCHSHSFHLACACIYFFWHFRLGFVLINVSAVWPSLEEGLETGLPGTCYCYGLPAAVTTANMVRFCVFPNLLTSPPDNTVKWKHFAAGNRLYAVYLEAVSRCPSHWHYMYTALNVVRGS